MVQCLNSLPDKLNYEIQKKVPLIGGSNWGGVVFDRVRDVIYRKWCEIELRWQLITNRKSYVGFRLQQTSMTLNDLERQFTALSVSQSINEFPLLRHNVAQCRTSLPAKFDYEIRMGPLDREAQTVMGWFLTSRCYTLETVRDRA